METKTWGAKEQYKQAYRNLRTEGRDYRDDPHNEIVSFHEIVQSYIDCTPSSIRHDACVSWMNRFTDELENREIDKAHTESIGQFYCWAKRQFCDQCHRPYKNCDCIPF